MRFSIKCLLTGRCPTRFTGKDFPENLPAMELFTKFEFEWRVEFVVPQFSKRKFRFEFDAKFLGSLVMRLGLNAAFST